MRKLIVLACSFFLVLVLAFWGMFYFTLPRPKTFHTHARIKEPVQVEWDGAGIPIIQSADLQDAYFVQGYLTARDRFFQMDLTRRRMSGKLSELFGPDALESDLQSRRWNYNKAAAVALSALEPI
ncbi:penicillin acylase family protein, partial [bacterium]|nr:penicillin acylase family protein [bacterium]